MKTALLIVSVLLSSNIYAQDIKTDKSITVHNLSNLNQQLWVNAVSYNISFDTSLRVPCNLGEEIEVQYIDNSQHYDCGSKIGLK